MDGEWKYNKDRLFIRGERGLGLRFGKGKNNKKIWFKDYILLVASHNSNAHTLSHSQTLTHTLSQS